MSHFTTIAVQITQGDRLYETLCDLGYTVLCNAQVRGYAGDRAPAEYVIRRANGYDLGFRQQGDRYELIADFWGVDLDATAFVQTVTQAYAHKTLMATVRDQGFNVETEEVLADGTVRVVVGRWV
jgi:hypothetical protein